MLARLGAAVLLALGMAVAPTAAYAGPSDDIAAMVNQARWDAGLNGLIRNAAMDQVAADWAAQMAANGAMSHNPDYGGQIPGGWVAAAENVAQGYPSGAATQDGWMGSSGHRANILGDYTDIGIAFLESAGTTWAVQVFAKYPGNVGPAAPAPPAPPPAPAPAPVQPAPEVADTPTPTPTPTVRATRTATPEPRGTEQTVVFTRDDPAGPPWWPLLVGAVLVAASAVTTVVRTRR